MQKITSTVLTALLLCAAPLGSAFATQEMERAPKTPVAERATSQEQVPKTEKHAIPERLKQRIQKARARLGKLKSRADEASKAEDMETLKRQRRAHQGERREAIKQHVKQWAGENPEKAERIRKARANSQKDQPAGRLKQAVKSRRGQVDEGRRSAQSGKGAQRGVQTQRKAQTQRGAQGRRAGKGQRASTQSRGRQAERSQRGQTQSRPGAARQRGQARRFGRRFAR